MHSDFWSQTLASLFGAFSAFVLSFLLFYLTQNARLQRKERALAANTVTEIETDISILEGIKAQIDDLCSEIDIETDKAKLYIPMNYKDVLYVFLPQTYSEGLLRKVFSNIEITELNRVISRNSKQTDDINLYLLNGYKGTDSNAPTQTKAELLRFFRSQKKQVDKDIKFLEDLAARLKKVSEK